MGDAILDVKKIVFIVIVFLGVVSCSRIYGLDEQWVEVLNVLFGMMTVLIIAIAVFYLYRFILKHFLDWIDDNIDDGEKSSMYPLLSVLGSILIAVFTTIAMLSVAGIDATAAILGGGIVGLAITFGAQSTLAQFFSGLALLMTRPFKSDDVVILNNNGVKLRVMKVGIMNSTFQEWETGQIFSMPNNTVTNATVANMTTNKGAYCMLIFFELALDVDFVKAKEVIAKAACRHPNVIVNRPEYYPLAEIDDFRTNCAYMKLTVYLDDFQRHGPICSEIRGNIIEDLAAANINFPRHMKYDVFVNGPTPETDDNDV